MKKLILFLFTCTLCSVSLSCDAFTIDRNQWKQFANVNNIELFYNAANIEKDGNTAKVWLCYHYVKSDSYRLINKKYVNGSNTSTVLRTLDYYSDGTFRRGSNNVVANVAFATNESSILSSIW